MEPRQYRAPTSLTEAVTLLSASAGRALQFTGGADELARLDVGPAPTDMLLDVSRIDALHVLDFDPSQGLTIGAAVPWCRVGQHPRSAAAYPCLPLLAAMIRSLPGRARATVGGSLCTPPAKSHAIPLLIALGASCGLVGPEGRRTVPLEGCYAADGCSLLGRGEVLVSVHLPAPRPHSGAWFIPFYPDAGRGVVVLPVAASLVLSQDHSRILAARVVLGGAGPEPLILDTISAVLVGQAPSEAVLNTAAALARVAAWPREAPTNAAYRAHIAGRLTRQALGIALSRARWPATEGVSSSQR